MLATIGIVGFGGELVDAGGVEAQQVVGSRTAAGHLPLAVAGVNGHLTVFRHHCAFVRQEVRLRLRPFGVGYLCPT